MTVYVFVHPSSPGGLSEVPFAPGATVYLWGSSFFSDTLKSLESDRQGIPSSHLKPRETKGDSFDLDSTTQHWEGSSSLVLSLYQSTRKVNGGPGDSHTSSHPDRPLLPLIVRPDNLCTRDHYSPLSFTLIVQTVVFVLDLDNERRRAKAILNNTKLMLKVS